MKKWLLGTLVVIGSVLIWNERGVNSNKAILSFSINNAEATINQNTGEMDVTLPTGTNLRGLIPVFQTLPANRVTVHGLEQTSGASSQNFESDVPYTVFASNGSTKNYFTHIITASNESGAYFQFYDLNSNTNGGLSKGVITGSTINVTVPSNTNYSSLVAFFGYIGKSVKIGTVKQISNVTANAFNDAVTYSIKANDGTANNYIVNVSGAAPTDDTINYFDLVTAFGTYPGIINQTSHTIHVGVPPEVPLRNFIADYSSNGSLVKVNSLNQISGLTVNNFESPVVYNVVSGDSSVNQNYTVIVDNYYTFLNVQNLAETIFDNTSYPVVFSVTNNEAAPITSISDTITMPYPIQWTLSSDTCSGVTLGVGSSCAVSGTLEIPKRYGEAAVKFVLKDSSNNTHASFNKIITAVPQLLELEPDIESPASYAAYTFQNKGAHRIYGAASVNGFSICFDSNNVGTISTTESQAWTTCAVEFTKGSNTLFIPASPGAGGKVLISVDGTIPDGPTPSVTATSPADTYYTRWQQVEYGGGLDGSGNPALFNLNPTNVDFISIPVTISTVISGVVGPWNNNSYAAQGILFGSNVKAQPVLTAIESGLDNVANAPVQSWDSLPQQNATSTEVLRVLSPSSVWPFMSSPSSQFYFDGSVYTQYIDDLWAYYTDTGGGNYLYSNDDPIAQIVSPGAHCILKCQVTASDNLMHCSQFSGSCPTNSGSGTLDGAYTGQTAGFTKFTPLDFVSAAGTPSATTFGENETYRSLTGENIVSGQAVGFMPFCTNTSFVFGNPEFVANQFNYYVGQYSCLTNYNSYTLSVIDQYAYQSSLYFGYYNYGYSDTLGEDGAIYNLNAVLYPFTIDVDYQ